MRLPLNAVYQFFVQRNNRAQNDPEKGPDQEPDHGVNTSTSRQNDASPGSDNDQETQDQENMPADEDEDEDFFDELEREESPDTQQPRRKRRFTGLSNLSDTTATSVSSWWSRAKDTVTRTELQTEAKYRYLPIYSGVLLPFSVLLEIPGNAGEAWNIRKENNKTVGPRPNTLMLKIGLAFSLTLLVLANLCLVLRYMEKKVKVMTILCVLFLSLHDLINIIALSVFGAQHRLGKDLAYGEAFWYTVSSTAGSMFVNVTLIIDCIRTPDFSKSGSGLTRKQRTLVLSVMTLLAYVAVGAAIEKSLLPTDNFIDALYFTVVTIETIGFGDITPKTTACRIFTCAYAIIGIVGLAVTVILMRQTVIEGVDVGYRMRVRAMRERRKRLDYERRVWTRWRAAVEWRLRNAGEPVWVKGSPPQRRHPCLVIRALDRFCPRLRDKGIFSELIQYKHVAWYGHYSHPRGMRLNVDVLSWPKLQAAAMEAGAPLRNLLPEAFKAKKQPKDMAKENGRMTKETSGRNGEGVPRLTSAQIVPPQLEGLPPTHARLGHMVVMLSKFALAVNRQELVKRESTASRRKDPSLTVAEHYQELRESMKSEEKWAFILRLTMVWTLFILFWIIGAVIFRKTESWSFGTGLYFCFISFTTIGYGDLVLITPAGRSVFVFWALTGAGTVTILISILSDAWSSRYTSMVPPDLIGKAMRRYRERTHKHSPAKSDSLTLGPTPSLNGGTTASTSAKTTEEIAEDSAKRAEGCLKTLPDKLLTQARKVQEDVQYLMQPVAMDPTKEAVPHSLTQLMNDVAGVERLGEEIKDEILRDASARQELLAISVENALRIIVEMAEEARSYQGSAIAGQAAPAPVSEGRCRANGA